MAKLTVVTGENPGHELATSPSQEPGGIQYHLFQMLPENDGTSRSNSIEMYDQMPKFTSYVKDRPTYLPILRKVFRWQNQEYELSIAPARIGDTDYYPSEDEEIIEQVLRKLAIQARALKRDNGEPTYSFTIYEVIKELKRIGRSMNHTQVRRCIEILNKCSVELRKLEPADARRPGRKVSATLSGPILPAVGVREDPRGENYARTVVSFHPAVANAIQSMDYRLIDYETSVRLGTSMGRWLYRRLTHSFTYAALHLAFNISATTILDECGLSGHYSRFRKAIEMIDRGLDELKRMDVIAEYFKDPKTEGPRNRITDVTYRIYPTKTFVRQTVQANAHRKKLIEIAGGKSTA